MSEDISIKSELLKYLDTAIENSVKDEAALADTPFVELPRANIKTNGDIKELVTKFADNEDKIKKIEEDVLNQITDINTQINAKTRDFSEKVYSGFKSKINIMLLSLLVIIILTFIINYLVSRSVNKIIRNSLELSEVYAKGDFTLKPKSEYLKRKDELGVISRAFDKMQKSISLIISAVINESNQMPEL